MNATVAEIARNPEAVQDAQPQIDPAMPPIAGSAKQLSLDVGGEKVSASEFKLAGGSIPIEGEFKKGAIVVLEVECRVGKIEFEDTVDPSGTVTRTVRRHVAKMESARRQ